MVIPDLPTVRTALAAHCQVAALCLDCDHVRDLDLEALAERHADTPLIGLPHGGARNRPRLKNVLSKGLGED